MYIHRALKYWQNVLTDFSYLLINFWHLSLTFKLFYTERTFLGDCDLSVPVTVTITDCDSGVNLDHLRNQIALGQDRDLRSTMFINDVTQTSRCRGIDYRCIIVWHFYKNCRFRWRSTGRQLKPASVITLHDSEYWFPALLSTHCNHAIIYESVH